MRLVRWSPDVRERRWWVGRQGKDQLPGINRSKAQFHLLRFVPGRWRSWLRLVITPGQPPEGWALEFAEGLAYLARIKPQAPGAKGIGGDDPLVCPALYAFPADTQTTGQFVA